MAIANHMSFDTKGFSLVGIFEKREELIGQEVQSLKIRSVKEIVPFCRKENPQGAILCIPREGAQEIVPTLIEQGINAFWNFSHYDISAHYEDIAVENVHLGDSLMTLCYQVSEQMDERE
jgi:redox-sensing transcriptional repressor